MYRKKASKTETIIANIPVCQKSTGLLQIKPVCVNVYLEIEDYHVC